jgi:hypothetical protein
MKFIKTAKNGLFYPILGIFLVLSLFQPSLQAMERPDLQATLVTPTRVNAFIDEVTDDETRIYLPEPKKVENNETKNLKRFLCTHEGCDYKASTKSNLNQHLMRHTKQKRFKCSFQDCTYTAYFECHMRAHMRDTHKADMA